MNDEIAAMSRAELERTIVELSASCYVWRMACDQWRETAMVFRRQAQEARGDGSDFDALINAANEAAREL